MYESSGSHVLLTTNGAQLGPGSFDESRLVMTFLINLRVTGIWVIFWLVQKEKANKRIPESSRSKVFKNMSTYS